MRSCCESLSIGDTLEMFGTSFRVWGYAYRPDIFGLETLVLNKWSHDWEWVPGYLLPPKDYKHVEKIIRKHQ